MPSKIYHVSQTLLGGAPDTNKRIIYEWDRRPDGTPDLTSERRICVLNDQMEAWSEAHEGRLQIILKALRAEDWPL